MSAVFTLAQAATYSADIRKSRFLANASPTGSVAEALASIATISREPATHHCWAYRIGTLYRFSDDGEPGGTAGRPILQAIDTQKLDRTVVVVTRWYGGIKLGAGGLARAYGGTAAECLRLAVRIAIVDSLEVDARVDFAALASLQARLAELGALQRAIRFDADGVILSLRVPAEHLDALRDLVRDLTRGRGDLVARESVLLS